MKTYRTAVVLHNTVTENSPEDVIDSLTQAAWIAELLADMGISARLLPFSAKNSEQLAFQIFEKLAEKLTEKPDDQRAEKLPGPLAEKPDEQHPRQEPFFVVNLVDAAPGETELAYSVPALLQELHLPFTGCTAEALLTTTDKIAAKRILRSRGIETPEWVGTASDEDQFVQGEKYIIKMTYEDASAGLTDDSVVSADSIGQLRCWLREKEQLLGSPFFAERYIDGREFNVCICGNRDNPLVLPPYEWKFEGYDEVHKTKIINYDAKWTEHTFEYDHVVPCYHLPESDAALLSSLREITRACWDIFMLHGYARVDFRIDAEGRPWVLEINGNPSFYGFYNIARHHKLDFSHIFKLIVQQLQED
jgi:D-alanine-D-alanine ligase